MHPKKKGYTLTEVLVVVLIIGVLSAVAYPVYTKAINKSRAIEAMNLLEMVRNKQISNHARKGEYLQDFTTMGQLTANIAQETVQGNKMSVGKYELAIYPEGACMTSAYVPAKGKSPIFTFSSGYEEAGLGCEGSVCGTFGNIVGGKESVCNCGDKNCGLNFNMDAVSCACSCPLECNQNNLCYDKTQTQATTQACGYNNTGTQARTCTASCDGGSCTSWSSCTGQSCNASTKPSTSQACASGCGSQTRTVTCNNGSWATGSWSGTCTSPTQTQATSQSCGNGGTQTRTCTANCSGGTCGAWGSCTGQACDTATKPSESQACASGCGTQTRTVTCNNGSWTTGNWGGSCSSPTQTQATSQSCGSGGTQTRTCTASCEGGTCGAWGACTGETKECPAASKPAETEACGNCGTKTRTVSCDTKTGTWTSGVWSACNNQGVCAAGTTQSCGNGGTQTCSTACAWEACTGEQATCDPATKPTGGPNDGQTCGACGRVKSTVSCNTSNFSWVINSDCEMPSGVVCPSGAPRSCGGGNGTQTCQSDCMGYSQCVCNSGYTWDGSTCKANTTGSINTKINTATQLIGTEHVAVGTGKCSDFPQFGSLCANMEAYESRNACAKPLPQLGASCSKSSYRDCVASSSREMAEFRDSKAYMSNGVYYDNLNCVCTVKTQLVFCDE